MMKNTELNMTGLENQKIEHNIILGEQKCKHKNVLKYFLIHQF